MDQTAEEPVGKVWRYSDGDKLTSMNSRFIVNMCYTNRTNKLVEVFWINFEGKEVNYGQVKPGATTLLYTYLTHPWVFRYEGGDETVLLVNGKPVSWPSQDNTYADIAEAPRLRWSPATHVSDFRRRAPDFARDVQNLLFAYFAQRKQCVGGDGTRRGASAHPGANGTLSPARAAIKAGACPSPAGTLSSCCGGMLWQRHSAGHEARRPLEAAFAEQRISASPELGPVVPASASAPPSGPFSSSTSSRHSSPPLRRSTCDCQQQQQQQQQQPSAQPHSASQSLLAQLPYDILLEVIAHMAPPLQEEHTISKDDVELLPRGVRPQQGPVAQLATALLGPFAPQPPDVPPEVWFEAAAVAAGGAEGAAAAVVPEPAGANQALAAAAAGAVNGAAVEGPLGQGALAPQNAPWGFGGMQQPQQQQQQPPGMDHGERAAQVAAVMLFTDAVALANTALLHVDRMLQVQEAQAGVLLARILASQVAAEAAATAQVPEVNGQEEVQQEQAAEEVGVAGPEQGQQEEQQQ